MKIAVFSPKNYAAHRLLFRDRRCDAGEERVVIDVFEKECGSAGVHRLRTDRWVVVARLM